MTVKGIKNDYWKNKEKGMGLGLVICKEFVKKHEGEIWFETKTGKGSTFFFTIKKPKD